MLELLEKGHLAWLDELDSSDEDQAGSDSTWQPDSDVTQELQELEEEELEEEELEQGEQQAAQQAAPQAALQAQLSLAVPPPGLPTGDGTEPQLTATMSLPSLPVLPTLPAIPILPNQHTPMSIDLSPLVQQHQQQQPSQLGQGTAHHLAAGSSAGQAGAADLASQQQQTALQAALQPQGMGGGPLQGVVRQRFAGGVQGQRLGLQNLQACFANLASATSSSDRWILRNQTTLVCFHEPVRTRPILVEDAMSHIRLEVCCFLHL